MRTKVLCQLCILMGRGERLLTGSHTSHSLASRAGPPLGQGLGTGRQAACVSAWGGGLVNVMGPGRDKAPPPPRGLWGSHQYPWTEALSLRLDLEAGEALRTTPHSPVLDGGGCKETLDLGRGEGGVDPDLRKHPFPKRVKATAWKSARARRHALTNTHALTHSSATHMALMTSPGRGRVFRVGVHLQASWAGPHPVGHALGSLRLQLDAHGGNPGPGRRRNLNQ